MITNLLRVWSGDQSLHEEINRNAAASGPINNMAREQLARDMGQIPVIQDEDKELLEVKRKTRLEGAKIFEALDIVTKVAKYDMDGVPDHLKSKVQSLQDMGMDRILDMYSRELGGGSGGSGSVGSAMGSVPASYAASPMDQDHDHDFHQPPPPPPMDPMDPINEEDTTNYISVDQWLQKNNIPHDAMFSQRMGTVMGKLYNDKSLGGTHMVKRRNISTDFMESFYPMEFEHIIKKAYDTTVQNDVKKLAEKVAKDEKEAREKAAKEAKEAGQKTLDHWKGNTPHGGKG